jgi:hypothetical protein
MPQIEPRKKNRAFLFVVVAAVLVAIAGALIAGHVHQTTPEANVPGQKVK